MMFSESLRSARQLHHLTQEQLSEISTIPKRTIENWEGGKSEPPSYVQKLVLDMISRIEEAGQ